MANKTANVKPGETVPQSGQYAVKGPRGGDTGKEVTLVKGKTAPPTDKSGQSFVMTDPTNNKSGRG
jgi:hypothetical protein